MNGNTTHDDKEEEEKELHFTQTEFELHQREAIQVEISLYNWIISVLNLRPGLETDTRSVRYMWL